MKLVKYIVVAALLVGIIFLQRKFLPNIQVITHTDTIFALHTDTIVSVKLVPYKEIIPPDTIHLPADTAEVVKWYRALHQEYYTRRSYEQNYNIDSIGSATVNATVFMNSLDTLSFKYRIRPATIINNTTINNVYSSGYFVGLGYNQGVTLEGSYLSKNAYIYTLRCNIQNGTIGAGVSININKLFKK